MRVRTSRVRSESKWSELSEAPKLDADFDGADEVDPRLNMVKGLGGAMVREKVVAARRASV